MNSRESVEQKSERIGTEMLFSYVYICKLAGTPPRAVNSAGLAMLDRWLLANPERAQQISERLEDQKDGLIAELAAFERWLLEEES